MAWLSEPQRPKPRSSEMKRASASGCDAAKQSACTVPGGLNTSSGAPSTAAPRAALA